MKFLNRVKSRTPESVELEFVLAGLGNRTYALIIDYLIWSSTLVVILIIWALLVTQLEWLRSDRKSTRLNSSHRNTSRMPSSA